MDIKSNITLVDNSPSNLIYRDMFDAIEISSYMYMIYLSMYYNKYSQYLNDYITDNII